MIKMLNSSKIFLSSFPVHVVPHCFKNASPIAAGTHSNQDLTALFFGKNNNAKIAKATKIYVKSRNTSI